MQNILPLSINPIKSGQSPRLVRVHHLLVRVLLGLAMLLGAGPAPAQEGGDAADRIKAAFIYRFTEYVTWPASAFARPDSPFVIGVLGDQSLATELAQLAGGRRVGRHPLTVRQLRQGDNLSEVHLLFVGQSENGRLSGLLAALNGRPVLTVTEVPTDPLHAAGMINFTEEGNRIRFDIALPAAERANLRISARLLSVARKVSTKAW